MGPTRARRTNLLRKELFARLVQLAGLGEHGDVLLLEHRERLEARVDLLQYALALAGVLGDLPQIHTTARSHSPWMDRWNSINRTAVEHCMPARAPHARVWIERELIGLGLERLEPHVELLHVLDVELLLCIGALGASMRLSRCATTVLGANQLVIVKAQAHTAW